MGKFLDLTGQQFGRLTCIERSRNIRKKTAWLCTCDCGNEVVVITEYLRSGDTKSCGCLAMDALLERSTTHGLCKGKDGKQTRLYNVWVGIRQRCTNQKSKDYKNYGGRGIRICDEWGNYETFHDWASSTGYRRGLTIERINHNGNYEPSNCKWVPKSIQSKNTRSCKFITFNGETKLMKQWSEDLGISYGTLKKRIGNGWDLRRAFTKPTRRINDEINKART